MWWQNVLSTDAACVSKTVLLPVQLTSVCQRNTSPAGEYTFMCPCGSFPDEGSSGLALSCLLVGRNGNAGMILLNKETLTQSKCQIDAICPFCYLVIIHLKVC